MSSVGRNRVFVFRYRNLGTLANVCGFTIIKFSLVVRQANGRNACHGYDTVIEDMYINTLLISRSLSHIADAWSGDLTWLLPETSMGLRGVA